MKYMYTENKAILMTRPDLFTCPVEELHGEGEYAVSSQRANVSLEITFEVHDILFSNICLCFSPRNTAAF